MKTTQQFCESIYHKYELALETRREKQRVRFMIVQRSAAAAAVVTVAVGSSVFVIQQKGGRLPYTPGTSVTAPKDPVGRALITSASAGSLTDDFETNMVPQNGEIFYSSSLEDLMYSEETDGAQFRLEVIIHGDRSTIDRLEASKARVRAQWEQQGITVEDPSYDISGDLVLTVDKDQIDQLAGEDYGMIARLAPAPRPEGYDRRLGDLAANWVETAGDEDMVDVTIYTVWQGGDPGLSLPNSDLYREEELREILDGLGLVPLPNPQFSFTFPMTPSMAEETNVLMNQYIQNRETIVHAADDYLNDALDALCGRIGTTPYLRTHVGIGGIPSRPDDPAFEGTFTWEGNFCSFAKIGARVTKAQLLTLSQDSAVRYVRAHSDKLTYELD